MRECLLCKRDMKTATTIFGNGCIKSIYNLLEIKMPKKLRDRESYLYKSIMKKLNIKELNSKQKVWLVDRYLTLQYIDRLKYGDYTELKKELNEDISNTSEIVEFSEYKTAEKVELKQAYTLYKKEEKTDPDAYLKRCCMRTCANLKKVENQNNSSEHYPSMKK